ncbi:Outer membrane protein beta-barrel domain-containing protein [Flavobacterium sp. CF108]|uniref:outer membrane beta-barrel protein n=1 Tax=unclassified Flavobacterium TaxID=196869 RepID=UPI0008D1FC48|nr:MULTISPECIES: outer membrane beta-barrel protein [unclassified Flavobacterium]SEO52704.1 Outer membrane protein beta-barrel domain-containing protein [Flavobacterium sp. fv08]SHH74389.1 Outer membrane protein beta-barrel domain-containing protein [Flavobacterium sp. CF108]
MKKLLVAVVLLVTTMMSAQKGSILLGGNVGFGSEKIGDDKYENFEFSPKAGYQFTDKWTLGVEGSILNYKESGSKREEAYRVGAFTRYSVPLSDLFSFYTDLGVGYQERSIDKTKGVYASLTPALFINMKNGFGLNFSIGGIGYDNLSGKETAREQRLGFNFGKTLNIGISKNFGL